MDNQEENSPGINNNKRNCWSFPCICCSSATTFVSIAFIIICRSFNNRPNITADPKEHLKRARKLLNKKHNSLLLYAAIELRFCIERVTKGDIYITSISNKVRKLYEPSKHISALKGIEPNSLYEHKIVLRNRLNGNEIDLGLYKPLDHKIVTSITGRLGDILHPKEGLSLGVDNCEWYKETRSFLWETHTYLKILLKDRRPYLGDRGLDEIWEILRK